MLTERDLKVLNFIADNPCRSDVIQRLLSLLAEVFTVLVIGIYIIYMDPIIAYAVIVLMTIIITNC